LLESRTQQSETALAAAGPAVTFDLLQAEQPSNPFGIFAALPPPEARHADAGRTRLTG
jgi:hypothetical protein